MDYFLLKQSGTVSIPKEQNPSTLPTLEPSIRIMNDIHILRKFDFIEQEMLISSRLKEILEQYLPEQPWRPCAFMNTEKKQQEIFWFLPPLTYQPEKIITSPSGIPTAVYINEQDFTRKSPGIFCIRSPKGTLFTIIHLSIAESILRRGICGLEIIRLSDQTV